MSCESICPSRSAATGVAQPGGITRGLALVCSPAAVLAGEDALPHRSLAGYEREKLRAFSAPDAQRSYAAAHLLVRRAASRLTGTPRERLVLSQRCEQCGGPHGRPLFADHPGLHVSLSHCSAAVAAVAGSARNAIDVECWDSLRFDPLLVNSVFAVPEREHLLAIDDSPLDATGVSARHLGALRLWVRKECLIKLGSLTLDTLSSIDVLPLEDDARGEFMTTTSGRGPLFITDWIDPLTRTVGAVASVQGVELIFAEA